jgi:hypothetical protein
MKMQRDEMPAASDFIYMVCYPPVMDLYPIKSSLHFVYASIGFDSPVMDLPTTM